MKDLLASTRLLMGSGLRSARKLVRARGAQKKLVGVMSRSVFMQRWESMALKNLFKIMSAYCLDNGRMKDFQNAQSVTLEPFNG